MAELLYNKIVILFPDNDDEAITEENIRSESMRIRQTICDESYLKFGGCIASEFKIDLLRTNDRSFDDSLIGKWISVKITQCFTTDNLLYPSSSLYPSPTLFPGFQTEEVDRYVFSGYIDSAVVSKTDNNVISITAYDILAKLHAEDATNDLYALYKSRMYVSGVLTIGDVLRMVLMKFNLTLRSEAIIRGYYRKSGAKDTRIQDYSIYLNSDWMNSGEKISFGQLLRDICEMLGAFGVIVPNSGKGSFEFRTLYSANVEEYTFFEPPLNAETYQCTGYTDFIFPVENDSDRPGKTVNFSDTSIGGLSDAYDGAVEKSYDFSANILTQRKYAQSGSSRTSTEFDYLVNTSSIGTRLAMNAESQSHPNACTLSEFTPVKVKLDARLWVKVGATVKIFVNKTNADGEYIIDETTGEPVREIINTYIFTRTITGIQAQTDEIETKGIR